MFDVSSYGRRYWRTIDCLMQSCQPSMLDSQASECKCQGLQTASDMHSMTQIWPKATSIAIKLCPCQREGKGWTVVLGCVVSLSYIRHSKNGNGLLTLTVSWSAVHFAPVHKEQVGLEQLWSSRTWGICNHFHFATSIVGKMFAFCMCKALNCPAKGGQNMCVAPG